MEEWEPLLAMGVVVLGVAATEWVVRRSVLAQVRKQMHANAAGAASSPAGGEVAEVAAAGQPQMRRIAAGEVPVQAYVAERRWLYEGIGLIKRVLWAELGLALACVLLLALPAAMAGTEQGLGMAVAGGFLGLLLATAAVGRYFLALHRFGLRDELFNPMPWDAPWLRWLKSAAIVLMVLLGLIVALPLALAGVASGVALVPLYWLLRTVARQLAETLITWLQAILSALLRVGALLLALVNVGAGGSLWARAAAGLLLLLASWHIWRSLGQARAMRHMPGYTLLVLRVFDQMQSSDFTFNRLMRFWRFFGHHYTVVDGSLVQASGRHKLGWPTRLGLAGWLMVSSIVATARLQDLGGPPRLLVSTAACTALSCVALVYYVRWRVARRFVRSRQQLRSRLARLDQRPRNFDLTYRHERALCHNDTWKMAVAEFACRADLVLMDLRGLQANNKGCETEMEFLFDTVPAARILFLVDGRDPPELDAQLARCWAWQAPSSPNLLDANPALTLYVAGGRDWWKTQDEQSLAHMLIWRIEEAAATAQSPSS